MPSTSRAAGGAHPSRRLTPRGEQAFADLCESLAGQVRALASGRLDLYDSARFHRQCGHVIPTTLCEALDENAQRLRDVLARYTETTSGR